MVFSNTAHIFRSTVYLQHLQMCCAERMWKREIKRCWRERGGESREFCSQPLHIEFRPSAKSAAGIRDQTALYGAKLLKLPLLLPQRLSESHTLAPALSSSSTGCLCESYQIIHILEGGGGVYLACHCVPRVSALPMVGSECLRSDITPGLHNSCWLINASRKHKHTAIALRWKCANGSWKCTSALGGHEIHPLILSVTWVDVILSEIFAVKTNGHRNCDLKMVELLW